MMRLYRFFIKTFLCIILFLTLGIICKANVQYKEYIQNKIYNESFSFSYFRNFYNKYLGGIFPIENVNNNETSYVFNETLTYSQITSYEDGAILSVTSNYLVPSMESGIVVYVGKKEKYGNVVMIEDQEGIDVWYGNMCHTLVNLYDTVEKGTNLGEVCDTSLYLVYTKGNDYLDYQEYLKS